MISRGRGEASPDGRVRELEELRAVITAQSLAIDRGFAALAVALAGAALELCERSGVPASWPEPPS
jgi:hypothetical protein